MLKPYNKAELTFERVRDIGADGRNAETFLSRDHQLNAEIVTKRIAKASLASPAEFFAESQRRLLDAPSSSRMRSSPRPPR